jgi:hypothetical protein
MHSRVVLQFLAEKYSKYLRAEVNRRENSESSGSPSSLVADAGDNLTGQGCLGSCGKASAILRRIKQPPASPRNIMPVFRVVVVKLPRRSGIFSQKFGYGGAFAKEIPGPRQLFQALQLDPPFDEPAAGRRTALAGPLCANTLVEVFGIMTGHRLASFGSQCRL